MRVLKDLTTRDLVETERKKGARLYKVPLEKRRHVKSIVGRASQHELLAESSPQTERFYANVIVSSLKHLLPEGWEICLKSCGLRVSDANYLAFPQCVEVDLVQDIPTQ